MRRAAWRRSGTTSISTAQKFDLEAVGDVPGHPIAVKVQQHERRAVLSVEDSPWVRAMVFACSLSFFLVTIPTLSGSPSRRAPSAIACDGRRLPISAASSSMPSIFTRSAVPRVITQAEPSLTSEPSGDSEMRLVSGPPIFVNLTSSI